MSDETETIVREYSYKASLLGPPWEFWLSPTGLGFKNGSRTGEIPYRDVKQIRLSFRPLPAQGQRFLAEIWARSGGKLSVASTTRKGLLEEARQSDAYVHFIHDLHARIGRADQTAYIAGLPAYRYWPALAVFIVLELMFAALTMQAFLGGQAIAGFLIGGFATYSLWHFTAYFRRNRPATYAPDEIPGSVLPAREVS